MASTTALRWLGHLTWVLIYAGLLVAAFGVSVQRTDDALGWSLVIGGALATALGAVLVYVRSRLKDQP